MEVVLIEYGKSINSTDKVEVKIFNSVAEAEFFCEQETDLQSKYWTYCSIIKQDEPTELFYNG